jgi:hypothetical protein
MVHSLLFYRLMLQIIICVLNSSFPLDGIIIHLLFAQEVVSWEVMDAVEILQGELPLKLLLCGLQHLLQLFP